MPKLTNKTQPGKRPPISNHLSSPFILCFKYQLHRGYTFDTLTHIHLKEFQRFLNQISAMTFQDVEKNYRRSSDSSDTFEGKQVIHYGFGKRFRIHGVIEEGQFVVLRIDPDHNYHD